jgi:hypothetical protein
MRPGPPLLFLVAATAPLAGQRGVAAPPIPAEIEQAAADDAAPEHRVRLSFRANEHYDLLASSDAAKRARGGAYVLALLRASAARAGRGGDAGTGAAAAGEAARPDGERGALVAHERLALEIAQQLSHLPFGGDGLEALPAVVWLLENDARTDAQRFAVKGLARIRSDFTSRYFAAVLAAPSPSRNANRYALDLVAWERLPATPEQLAAFAQLPDERVRDRARALLRARGTEPAPYDPGESLGPFVEGALEIARELLPERVPPEAAWVELQLPEARDDTGENQLHGWLLQEGGVAAGWRVMAHDGVVVELPPRELGVRYEQVTEHAKRVIGWRERWRRSDGEGDQRWAAAQLGVRDVPPRRRGAAWPGSVAELLVASWCDQAGERAATAGLLEPLFAAAHDDRDALGPLLRTLAANAERALATAFVQRDDERARELAATLCRPELDGVVPTGVARQLSRQLAPRAGGAPGLELPQPAEWERLRRELPRAQAIAWLVARLHLLACPQPMFPGLADWAQAQSSPPANGGEPVARINPFVELLRLDLATGELPLLLPALATGDLARAIEAAPPAWGSPAERPRLVPLAGLAAAIVEQVLREPFDVQPFVAGGAARADAAAELNARCRVDAEVRRSDRLERELAGCSLVEQLMVPFLQLHLVDPVRAAEVLRAVARREPELLPAVVCTLVQFDRHEFLGEARAWREHADPQVRFHAACLQLRHGVDAAAALQAIEAGFDEPDAARWADASVEALLAAKDPAARALLLELQEGRRPAGFRPSPGMLQRTFRAGLPGAREQLERAIRGDVQLRFSQLYAQGGDARAIEVPLGTMRTWAAGWWGGPTGMAPMGMAWQGEPAPPAEPLLRQLAEDERRVRAGERPRLRPHLFDLPWANLAECPQLWGMLR